MPAPRGTRAPKSLRFSFSTNCMTKDNQLAVCTPAIKYQSCEKMDEWFNTRVKSALERMVDDYVVDQYLYDVTSDRNPPKDLIKKMTERVKEEMKIAPKPTPVIKLEEVSLIIKRDR